MQGGGNIAAIGGTVKKGTQAAQAVAGCVTKGDAVGTIISDRLRTEPYGRFYAHGALDEWRESEPGWNPSLEDPGCSVPRATISR